MNGPAFLCNRMYTASAYLEKVDCLYIAICWEICIAGCWFLLSSCHCFPQLDLLEHFSFLTHPFSFLLLSPWHPKTFAFLGFLWEVHIIFLCPVSLLEFISPLLSLVLCLLTTCPRALLFCKSSEMPCPPQSRISVGELIQLDVVWIPWDFWALQ